MRLCKYCGLNKPHNTNVPAQTRASGFWGARCWDCWTNYRNAYNKQWRLDNWPQQQALTAKWRLENKEAMRIGAKKANDAWYIANPGARSELTQRYNADKLNRTPLWADLEQIRQIYAQASKEDKVVDHIVPLRGKLVSGLHVHYNLQLLTKSENSSKNNKFEVA